MAAAKAAYKPGDVYGYVQFPDEDDVVLEITKTKQDKAEVPVSVQFQTYHLPRGKLIIVKKPLFEALKNAVQVEYEQDEKTGELIGVEVPSIPFQVK